MRISNRQFSGERPKQEAWNLNENEAQLAIDCELTSTGIRAMRENSIVQRLPFEPKTIYYFGDQWLAWEAQVDIIESPIGTDTQRLFWTGDGYPQQSTAAEYAQDISYRMGVPTPAKPTFFSITGDADEPGSTGISTFFVATFVNKWGEEGDKSVPSSTRTFKTGQILKVLNIGNVTDNEAFIQDYGTIVATRLYRLDQGFSRFVAEISITNTTYEDDTGSTVLGDAFSTEDFVPPPEDMQGLHVMTNAVALGFVGRTVYVSEPGQLNAWPYSFPVRSDIVGISSFDNTAVILTKGYPELATIYDPQNISPATMTQRQPCVSRPSILQAAGGVMYATPTGLFFISSSGGQLLTGDFMDDDNWKALNPETIHAAYRDGQYYAWHMGDSRFVEGRCWVFDTRESNATVRQLSAYYRAAHVKPGTDDMFLANGALLEEFQGAEGRLTYRWLSKEHGIGNPIAMTCARVISMEYGNVVAATTREALRVEREAAIARNSAVLLLRSVLGVANGYGGAINQDVIGGAGLWLIPGAASALGLQELGVAINNGGDRQLPADPGELFLDVMVHADSQLLDLTRIVDEEPYRLTYGDRVRHWEYELEGNVDVQQFDMAGSESEMHSGS